MAQLDLPAQDLLLIANLLRHEAGSREQSSKIAEAAQAYRLSNEAQRIRGVASAVDVAAQLDEMPHPASHNPEKLRAGILEFLDLPPSANNAAVLDRLMRLHSCARSVQNALANVPWIKPL